MWGEEKSTKEQWTLRTESKDVGQQSASTFHNETLELREKLTWRQTHDEREADAC